MDASHEHLEQVSSAPHPVSAMIACIDCDLLFEKPTLKPGEKATCWRCGALLYQRTQGGLDQPIALVLTSVVLFVLSNVYPLLLLNIGGRVEAGLIMTGVEELYLQGFWEVAVLVFLVAILLPLVRILSLLYVILPLWMGIRLPRAAQVFRMVVVLQPWAMSEVFMLGILVAIVKLGDLASIEVGVALYSFSALIVVLAAANSSLDEHEIWEQLGDSH